MAANTFVEMARSLRLFVPHLPLPLAHQFIRDRYRKILEMRGWSGLRAEGEFLIREGKSAGTVDVTRESATVVGTGTAFTSTDVGRQFKVGTGSPIYTIGEVDVGGQALVLDRVFGGETATDTTYRIFDGYVTAPADFMRFTNVIDPINGWKIRHWITQDEIDAFDPQRTFFGDPYALVDRRFIDSGRIQFEAWPYAMSEHVLHFYYIKRGVDLVDDEDIPIWPIRSDVIVDGARMDLCRYPGTVELPNPMFARMDVYRSFKDDYEQGLIDLERQDENIYMTWLLTQEWNQLPYAPWSANFIQTHAV